MIQTWPRAKDPDESLRYFVDWSEVLADDGDEYDSVAWALHDDLTGSSEQFDEETGHASIVIEGGIAGETYRVGCRLTTTGGNIHDRTCKLNVINR